MVADVAGRSQISEVPAMEFGWNHPGDQNPALETTDIISHFNSIAKLMFTKNSSNDVIMSDWEIGSKQRKTQRASGVVLMTGQLIDLHSRQQIHVIESSVSTSPVVSQTAKLMRP
ncbi:hypothetical protein J6590_019559 [Homalodisca vitripennis]|nr:hypothetical protein J6590_019559 [Homalodisca vitripennis]